MEDGPLTEEELAFTDTVEELTAKISPLFAGHPCAVQGAILGHLVATWLGGYYTDDPAKQMELWTGLLTEQAKLSLRLVANDRRRKRAG